LKPLIDVNFDEVFANSAFLSELSAMVFGAELALNYANIPDNQLKAITDKIVQSAFASFASFNYDSMYAASRPKSALAPPLDGGAEPFYSSTPAAYGAAGAEPDSESEAESGFDYHSNPPVQLPAYESPAAAEPYGFSARPYQAPAGGFKMKYQSEEPYAKRLT
jgi:hypothetical protein